MLNEMIASVGYDYVVVDMEHWPADVPQTLRCFQAIDAGGSVPIARLPANDPVWIKRVLDAGVEGVLVPQIYTAADAKAVVNACRYPPQGERGIAAGRGHKYGLDFMDTLKRSNEEILVLVQIETKAAVDNVEDILAVPGLDGVLIGPADLSAALGHTLDFEAPDVVAAFEKTLKAGKAAGKPVGFYCNTPGEAKARLAEGYSFVNICSDSGLLLQGYARALGEMAK